MKKLFICTILYLLAISCSKDDSSAPDTEPTYVNAAGTWSVQSTKQTYNGSSVQYNATDHPCLSDNKYEFGSVNSGRFFYAGSDTCFLYKNGSTTVYSGLPGTENELSWMQKKDTIIITYAGNFKDTGILSSISSKEYLTITNRYPSESFTVILTR